MPRCQAVPAGFVTIRIDFNNRVAASVTTLTPRITQNNTGIDWEKDSRTIAGPSEGVIASSAAGVEAKILAWIAPRIDTPIAPPRLRVNVARPDAMPISPFSTEFWNATMVDGIIIPLPNPSGIPMTISCRREGDGRTQVRTTRPTETIAAPTKASLLNPSFEIATPLTRIPAVSGRGKP